jgi:hypothetical protein
MVAVFSSACIAGPTLESTKFDCTDFMTFSGQQTKVLTQFEADPQAMAWNWFLCMNDPVASSDDDRVWENLKPTDQVFLANGDKPKPYVQRESVPAAVQKQMKALNMNPKRIMHNLDSIQQVDGLILEMGGVVPSAQKGKPVRFQLLMNQGTFGYIIDKAVYNVNGQAALTADLNFPSAAWELKTAWLWIGTDPAFKKTLAADGYYIVQAYFLDQGVYKVGYAALSGMHIINKLTPDWVWTTFENTNNSKYTVTNAIPATPMHNTTGPTPAAATANSQFQGVNPALSQYELIGVQYKLGQEPKLLANSQLESAFQSQSSCVACHSTAAYSATKGYFNFALPHNDGIAYPTQALPASAFDGYNKLDFVWSLKRASWKR